MNPKETTSILQCVKSSVCLLASSAAKWSSRQNGDLQTILKMADDNLPRFPDKACNTQPNKPFMHDEIHPEYTLMVPC